MFRFKFVLANTIQVLQSSPTHEHKYRTSVIFWKLLDAMRWLHWTTDSLWAWGEFDNEMIVFFKQHRLERYPTWSASKSQVHSFFSFQTNIQQQNRVICRTFQTVFSFSKAAPLKIYYSPVGRWLPACQINHSDLSWFTLDWFNHSTEC